MKNLVNLLLKQTPQTASSRLYQDLNWALECLLHITPVFVPLTNLTCNDLLLQANMLAT